MISYWVLLSKVWNSGVLERSRLRNWCSSLASPRGWEWSRSWWSLSTSSSSEWSCNQCSLSAIQLSMSSVGMSMTMPLLSRSHTGGIKFSWRMESF